MTVSNRPSGAKKFLPVLFIAVVAYILGAYFQAQYGFPMKDIAQMRFSLFRDYLRANVPSAKLTNMIFKVFGFPEDVVMIGDSITAGGAWEEMFPNLLVTNSGIAGDRTDDILERLDQVISTKPRRAFIMAGINDIYQGRNVDQIMSDFTSIVDRLCSAGLAVFIQSTLECSRNICGGRLDTVRELNEKLQKYALENHVTYININQNLTTENDGLRPQFTSDGVHLLSDGYVEWSRAISSYMN